MAKTEFYLLLQEKGKAFKRTDLNKFVKSHPGVQWRPVGKDDFQIMFRKSEGWLNGSTFQLNYRSSLEKQLRVQLQRCREVFSEEEVLAIHGVKVPIAEMVRVYHELSSNSGFTEDELFKLSEMWKDVPSYVEALMTLYLARNDREDEEAQRRMSMIADRWLEL